MRALGSVGLVWSVAVVLVGAGCADVDDGADAAPDIARIILDLRTTPHDMARPPLDLALDEDLASPDLGAADLSVVSDLAVAVDLARAPDLARSPDLAQTSDLARLPDLAQTPDLARAPDLASPPDMASPYNHLTFGGYMGYQTSSYFNLALWNLVGSAGQLCIPVQDGPCTILDCLNPAANGTTLPKWTKAVDAGRVTITDGVTPTAQTRSGTTGLYALNSGPSAYAAGDQLTFSGAGGADVPAFQTTLTMPSLLSVTSPTALQRQNGLSIDRTRPFTATWTPTTGTVTITFGQQGNMSFPYIREAHCHYDASLGTGTVPASTLAKFDSTAALNPGYGLVGHGDTKTVTAGAYVLDVEALNYEIWDASFK